EVAVSARGAVVECCGLKAFGVEIVDVQLREQGTGIALDLFVSEISMRFRNLGIGKLEEGMRIEVSWVFAPVKNQAGSLAGRQNWGEGELEPDGLPGGGSESSLASAIAWCLAGQLVVSLGQEQFISCLDGAWGGRGLI
ncbi:MAG: hypothetical protein SX243_08180, partial [Acidobacteriota bacterium]|nr:hypothetical protein [Acidobacteriota bacterium]